MTRAQNSHPRKKKSFVLSFDEQKREEYLTGFSKRKKLRREKAEQEKLAKLKAIRAEKKKKKTVIQMPSEVQSTSRSFDLGNHSVVVTEYDMLAGDDIIDTDAASNKISDPKDTKKVQKKKIWKRNKPVPSSKKGSKPGKSKHRKSNNTSKTKRKHMKPSLRQ